ncbi:MucB/RseB C-terminal domain-containing protein [Hydrogenophaga aromaticivorans]|nr:MucB/RseB C-terminal domain-containing protein [Hydrogenophaga aromaticivorans]
MALHLSFGRLLSRGVDSTRSCSGRGAYPGARLQPWSGLLLVVLVLGLWQPLVQAQSQGGAAVPTRSVNEWLTRMQEASRQRAYTGTLVVSAGSVMSASRIWHVCDGVQQMERIETLTGAPRTTIRRNNEVITFVPDAKTAWIEERESLGLFPDLLRTPANAIPKYYEVRETGVQRVAGHLADVVEILPRDPLRFGFRIWSEQKTGLVVKLQTLGEKDVVLEQLAYSELQLDAPVRMDKLRKMMKDTRGYEVYRPVVKKTTPEAEGWQFKDVAPGFLRMSCHTRDASESTEVSSVPMQCIFSDGLASVSLFVEPLDARRHGAETSAVMGATHSLGMRLGNHWLTVLGEVPPVTLQRFAQALQRTR